jgi:hypothetical protein
LTRLLVDHIPVRYHSQRRSPQANMASTRAPSGRFEYPLLHGCPPAPCPVVWMRSKETMRFIQECTLGRVRKRARSASSTCGTPVALPPKSQHSGNCEHDSQLHLHSCVQLFKTAKTGSRTDSSQTKRVSERGRSYDCASFHPCTAASRQSCAAV